MVLGSTAGLVIRPARGRCFQLCHLVYQLSHGCLEHGDRFVGGLEALFG